MTTNDPEPDLDGLLIPDDVPDLLAEIHAADDDPEYRRILDQITAEQDEITTMMIAADAETERIMAPYLEQDAADMAAVQAALIAADAEYPVTAALTDTADQDARLAALIGSVDDLDPLPDTSTPPS